MSRSLGYVTVVDPNTEEVRSVRYDEFVRILLKSRGTIQQDLEHGIIGCCEEAGELAGAIKKFTVYGKSLDLVNVIEELGDLRWYMQAVQNLLGISEQELLQANTNKLAKRYKNLVYSEEAAIARADKKEGE